MVWCSARSLVCLSGLPLQTEVGLLRTWAHNFPWPELNLTKSGQLWQFKAHTLELIFYFLHDFLKGSAQTSRPTDGLGDRSVKWALTLAELIQRNTLIILLEQPVLYSIADRLQRAVAYMSTERIMPTVRTIAYALYWDCHVMAACSSLLQRWPYCMFFTVTFVYIHFNPHFNLEPD